MRYRDILSTLLFTSLSCCDPRDILRSMRAYYYPTNASAATASYYNYYYYFYHCRVEVDSCAPQSVAQQAIQQRVFIIPRLRRVGFVQRYLVNPTFYFASCCDARDIRRYYSNTAVGLQQHISQAGFRKLLVIELFYLPRGWVSPGLLSP